MQINVRELIQPDAAYIFLRIIAHDTGPAELFVNGLVLCQEVVDACQDMHHSQRQTVKELDVGN